MSQYAQVGKPFCPWTLFNSTALTHFPVQKFTQELCSLSQTEVYVGPWVQNSLTCGY